MNDIEAKNTLREIAMFFEDSMRNNGFVDKKQIRKDIDALNEGIRAIDEREKDRSEDAGLVALAGAFEKFKESYIELVDAVYKTDEDDYCVSEEMADKYPFTGSFDELDIEDWCDLQMEKITDHIKNGDKDKEI